MFGMFYLIFYSRFDDSAEGGENMFLDVFHSVAQLRKHYPQHFDTLTRVPATFQKIHFERYFSILLKCYGV